MISSQFLAAVVTDVIVSSLEPQTAFAEENFQSELKRNNFTSYGKLEKKKNTIVE